MNVGKWFIFVVVALFLVGNVTATGLSIQLKRTNPGIAGEKSAELIFDVVNTDFEYKMEGFLWCRSPDDAVISSTIGVGTGSGAQYVSPRFNMDSGPSQKAMSLTINADSPGDKRTGCTVKYAPYRETITNEEIETVDISYDGTIGVTETDISGFKVKLISFIPEVEAVEEGNETIEGSPEMAVITVNDIPKEMLIGDSANIGGLTVELLSATENSADVSISGTVTQKTNTAIIKQYLKMNGQLVNSLSDGEYREIRLDKTVPFVSSSVGKDVKCPESKTTCNSDEVVVVSVGNKTADVPVLWLIVSVVLVVLVIAYLLGKTSRKH